MNYIMNIVIGIGIVVITIGIIAGYYFYQTKYQKVDNFNNTEDNLENIMEEKIPEIKEEPLNFDEMEHLGYLFKNGTNENHDNLNLYFNTKTNDFIALTHDQMLINLGKESTNEGDKLNINNEMYIVKLSES